MGLVNTGMLVCAEASGTAAPATRLHCPNTQTLRQEGKLQTLRTHLPIVSALSAETISLGQSFHLVMVSLPFPDVPAYLHFQVLLTVQAHNQWWQFN